MESISTDVAYCTQITDILSSLDDQPAWRFNAHTYVHTTCTYIQ